MAILSTLRLEGHQGVTSNLNHIKGTSEEIIRNYLDASKYDFVCTGNTALGYHETESILNAARNHRTKPNTLLGGIIVTAEPEIVFKALMTTFAVIGEGEHTVLGIERC